jgi:aspartyl protease family protein
MRQILIFALMVGAGGIGIARHLDRHDPKSDSATLAMAQRQPPPAPSAAPNYRTVTLNSDRRGHFQVDARVEGRSIDFLVDTGASSVALRESAAARLGIHPAARDYSVKVQTANGVGKAARVRLDRVEIAGITVRDVEALVVPDNALATNLLGMSFLSRVKWTHERGRLVLEQ